MSSTAGLPELEAVLAIARRGTFRAAAHELGMSPSALSHAVSALEARLGVRLFNRTTRSVSLSSAGQEFVTRLAPAVADIREALTAARNSNATPRGVLRLNTSLGAAQQLLAPLFFEYLRRYPEMRLELATDDRLIDIVAGGFDAGLRLAETVPQDMIAIPLGETQCMAVVASPDFLARHPAPRTPGDLAALPCIRYRLGSGAVFRWDFERRGEVVLVDVQGPLLLDEMGLVREAARAGFGIAYVSERSVLEDLAAGRLVRLMEEWTPPFPGLCLYYPGRRNLPAGLRALVDLIRERAQQVNR